MNREDITRMARDADLHAFGGDVIEALERFAALVAKHTLSNIDPRKFMSWQEGYAAGAAAAKAEEREACAKVCEELHPGLATRRAAEIIRARGNT